MAKITEWTHAELEASVDAYLRMLQMETDGHRYVKSKVNQELREGALRARSKGSIEYRMQNISAVMQELGFPWVQGYKPALNVGEKVRKYVKDLVVDRYMSDGVLSKPTVDPDEYRRRSDALRKVKPTNTPKEKPKGQDKPKSTTTPSKSYYRDPEVRAWVLNESAGNCEACGCPAPFTTEGNTPFLEAHHMKLLADHGPDVVENAVAICPNCHRRLHLSSDRAEFAEQVYERVERLKKF